jgi:uncharacterized protein YndB with AHSA1/START domain
MAHNTGYIDADPDTVFAVLSDASTYADWVVGSRRVRDADADFPAVGSRFHHEVGIPPLLLRDHTEVLECRPPTRLVLRAKTRPFATARVELSLTPQGTGTRVELDERAGDLPSRWALNRFSDPLIHLRNTHSLRRLRRISEARSARSSR